MKILAAVLVALVAVQAGAASAQQLGAFTNSLVYSDGQPLFVYGTATPGENLVVRLFAPDGTIAKFDQITADDDGSFNHVLLTWPESSTGFPYGTYTVEVISAVQDGLSKSIDVKFTSSTELVDIPIERRVSTTVFAPETSGINTPMRIFVQTTSDGLLIGGDPSNLLDTTHVHLPSGNVEDLAGSFQTLHQGLYFVDYSPDQLGTYVFHVVTFHQGTVSHGSAATNVLSQDIGGISDQIVRLNTILDETLEELDRLNSEVSEFGSQVSEFGSVLETASENIDDSVDSVSSSVANIEEASLQLNSLLFPVIAVISIIVALQIVILARRR